MNTREYRYRKRLEDERHKLIEKAVKVIPNYHPPSDYRRPTKTQEKVYVPVNDYPEINFSMITNPLTPNLRVLNNLFPDLSLFSKNELERALESFLFSVSYFFSSLFLFLFYFILNISFVFATNLPLTNAQFTMTSYIYEIFKD